MDFLKGLKELRPVTVEVSLMIRSILSSSALLVCVIFSTSAMATYSSSNICETPSVADCSGLQLASNYMVEGNVGIGGLPAVSGLSAPTTLLEESLPLPPFWFAVLIAVLGAWTVVREGRELDDKNFH